MAAFITKIDDLIRLAKSTTRTAGHVVSDSHFDDLRRAFGDDLGKAIEKGKINDLLADSRAAGLSNEAKAILRSPELQQLSSEFAAARPMIADIIKKTRHGQTPDLGKMFEEYGVKNPDLQQHIRDDYQLFMNQNIQTQLNKVNTIAADTGRNTKTFVYRLSKWSDEKLSQYGAPGRLAGKAVNIAGEGVSWGFPAIGTGAAAIVAAHALSGGTTTDWLAAGFNAFFHGTADAVGYVSEDAEKFLRELGPESVEVMFEIMALPVDTASTFVMGVAKRNGIEMTEQESRAIIHAAYGNMFMSVLTVSGHEIDKAEMARIVGQSLESDDPKGFIAKKLQEELGLTDEQKAMLLSDAEEMRINTAQAIGDNQDFLREQLEKGPAALTTAGARVRETAEDLRNGFSLASMGKDLLKILGPAAALFGIFKAINIPTIPAALASVIIGGAVSLLTGNLTSLFNQQAGPQSRQANLDVNPQNDPQNWLAQSTGVPTRLSLAGNGPQPEPEL